MPGPNQTAQPHPLTTLAQQLAQQPHVLHALLASHPWFIPERAAQPSLEDISRTAYPADYKNAVEMPPDYVGPNRLTVGPAQIQPPEPQPARHPGTLRIGQVSVQPGPTYRTSQAGGRRGEMVQAP